MSGSSVYVIPCLLVVPSKAGVDSGNAFPFLVVSSRVVTQDINFHFQLSPKELEVTQAMQFQLSIRQNSLFKLVIQLVGACFLACIFAVNLYISPS